MRISTSVSAVALSLLMAGSATAEYPDRVINYILPTGAGSTADLKVRAYLPVLEKCLGRPVVPINRPAQAAAWAEVANAAPDGYTITYLSHPNLVFTLRGSDVKYKMESFEWLGNVYPFHTTLVVRKDSPIQDIGQLVERLKTKGDVKIGITRLTSDDGLLFLGLKKILNVDFKPVPLGDSNKTMAALLGGHVDAIVASHEVAIGRKDEVRALAIANETRYVDLPDVPTFAEKNMPIVIRPMQPIAAPAGLAPEVRSKLTACVATIAKDAGFLADAKKRSFTVGYMEAAKVGEYLKQDFVDINTLLDTNKALLDANP